MFSVLTMVGKRIEETAAAATVALRGEICTTDETQRAYIERCPFGVVLGMVSSTAGTLEMTFSYPILVS